MTNISSAHPSKFRIVFPYMDFLGDNEKGEDLVIWCSEVTLPGITMDVTEIENPYYTQKVPSSRLTFDEITITYSLDELYTSYKFIHSWLMYCKDPERFEVRDAVVDASLHIYSNNSNQQFSFTLKNVFPTAIDPIMFTKREESSDDFEHTATFAVEYFLINEGS